jgi:outer membrane protein assembly factor BamB
MTQGVLEPTAARRAPPSRAWRPCRGRLLRLLLLLATASITATVTACAEPPLVRLTDGATAAPERLDLGRAYVGARVERELTVENAGRTPRTLQAHAPAPFAVTPARLTLAPGEARTLTVQFTPQAAGPHAAALSLAGEGTAAPRTVSLLAEALAPLACAAPTACSTERFDAEAGACVRTDAPDDSPCADACLEGARCQRGACLGRPLRCDDGDACTADACQPGAGCVHTALTCEASADPCRSAFCDPVRGCALADAPDGTACGAPARCGSDRVEACVAGACRQVPVSPDAACPPAPCGPETAEGPALLQRAWRYTPPAGWLPVGTRLLADRGALYWLEREQGTGARVLASVASDGRPRFRAPLPPETAGAELHMVAGPLVLLTRGQHLLALSAADGRPRWTVDAEALARRLAGRDAPPTFLSAHFTLQSPAVLGATVSASWWREGDAEDSLQAFQAHLSLADGTLRASTAGPMPSLVRTAGAVDRTGAVHVYVNLYGFPRVFRYGPTLTPDWRGTATWDSPSEVRLAVADGVLVSGAGGLRGFDVGTGLLLWEENGAGETLLQDGHLLTHGERASSAWGDAWLEGREARTGARRWAHPTPEPATGVWLSQSGAALAATTVAGPCPGDTSGNAACPRAERLQALALGTGERLWQCRTAQALARGSVLLGEHWTGWERDARGGVVALASYALPGWDLSHTGWPQLDGGPERQRRERGP